MPKYEHEDFDQDDDLTFEKIRKTKKSSDREYIKNNKKKKKGRGEHETDVQRV